MIKPLEVYAESDISQVYLASNGSITVSTVDGVTSYRKCSWVDAMNHFYKFNRDNNGIILYDLGDHPKYPDGVKRIGNDLIDTKGHWLEYTNCIVATIWGSVPVVHTFDCDTGMLDLVANKIDEGHTHFGMIDGSATMIVGNYDALEESVLAAQAVAYTPF